MRRSSVVMVVALSSLLVADLAVAGRAPYAERLRASAQLSSESLATATLILNLNMGIALAPEGGGIARGNVVNGFASGTAKCRTADERHPCPAPTAKLSIGQPYPGIGEGLGRSFFRYSIHLEFDASRSCELDGYSPDRVDSPFHGRAPLMLFGTFVCTVGDPVLDRGVFSMWQRGQARLIFQK
jgi:hypothetical protein